MTLSESILATLAYHDIFDYPLAADEIHKYLIGKKTNFTQIKKGLEKLIDQLKIGEWRGYYHLGNRRKIVTTRVKRAEYSKPKYQRVSLFTNILRIVPTLRLVAISGALAMDNSNKNDDIDLVIITAKNTLWTTRFLANTLLFPFKRKPLTPTTHSSTHNPQPTSHTNNRACLNLYLDESALKISPQNLYMAHEICQMKPILDRDKTYSRFIKANQWVKKYLPNWQPTSSVIPAPCLPAGRKAGIHKTLVVSRFALVVENFLKNFQLWYMHKKISTERIGKHQLFFHPSNTQQWVLKEYQKRLQKLKLGSKN